jgi:PAS domain S-box-containing protein
VATWHENQLVPIHRNGRLEDVYWTYGYSPVRDSAGRICGTLVVCTETTEIVLVKSQAQQELERLADLFRQAPAFFAVLHGPDHVFEMTNPLYEELIGRHDVVGKTVREVVPEAEEQGFLAMLDEVHRTGKPFVGRSIPIQLARGGSARLEMRYLNFVYQPRRDADGTVSGIILLGVDVTEGKRAEQVLLQSEKLNAVGRLASSIAHEINNPLESITNLLYLIRQSESMEDVQHYTMLAQGELARVTEITLQTLRFNRQQSKPVEVDMAELLRTVMALYTGRIMVRSIDADLKLMPSPRVLSLEGEIRQVMNNLVRNALDAMSSGGRLLVRLHPQQDWHGGTKGVRLTVADTGEGIRPEMRAHLFEPFQTTKEMTGTGLGLWVSKGIVEKHGGYIRTRTRRGKGHGTVFTVWLPLGGSSNLTAPAN